MNKQMFTFELIDKFTPDVVIKGLLEEVEVATQGYVLGNIAEYDGLIDSYNKIGLKEALDTLDAFQTATVDIQKELGELYNEEHKYEVFLTVKGLERYKYRMMFVKYGTVSYPVKIVMNEELAIAYSGKRKSVFYIDSMKELAEMINTVINSDTMVTLIQNLINESLRQEANG